MSSCRRPWYPWYPSDFNQDEKVRMLSDDAELLYRRALDVLWQANDLQLPSNCLKLAKALARGWSTERFKDAWDEIQTPGFELLKTTDDGQWIYSKRLKLEAEKIEAICQQRRIIGKKGGEAKVKQLASKSLPKVTAKPKQTPTHPDPDPDIKKERDTIVSQKKKSFSIRYYQYPDWLDSKLWAEYVEMRSRSKHPITSETGITRLLNSLKKLIDEGHDQGEIIGLALERNWRGFFAPTINGGNGNGLSAAEQAKRDALMEHYRQLDAEDARKRQNQSR